MLVIIEGNVRKCMDESILLQDDSDLMKVAEDLRNCTPRTSARKLLDLMQRRGQKSARKDPMANKFT